ncbi:MAG: 4-alpha-glucanotransferase [Vicinamibacterales bacterium]
MQNVGTPYTRSARRHAGLLLPLASAVSQSGWGIGELSDLPLLARWMRRCGLDFLLLLPINEMQASQHSPYSAVSAMAIDPIYVSLGQMADFAAIGGEHALEPSLRATLTSVRASERVDFSAVRDLKMTVLRRAYVSFRETEWTPTTSRGRLLREFMTREAWWLDDYTVYRALRDRYRARPWWEWEPGVAGKEPGALADAREALMDDRLFYAYVQWIADEQWATARAVAAPVGVYGDLPFMVSADSADAWAEQHAFRFDATVGAPPDAFSDTGQDWGLPAYRWDVFAREGDAWLRARARRAAALFDAFRVDHVVGFYRTYVIAKGNGHRAFEPPFEPEQLAQGERVLTALLEAGAGVLAEDLGTIPTFVRESLQRLEIPGYKVLRWEREWDREGQPFRDPLHYPPVSLATTGTHDTETLAEWWESASFDERVKVLEIPFLRERRLDPHEGQLSPEMRDAVLELMWASASSTVVVPVQDVFGWRERVNIPATVTEWNWTWRLPVPVDDLIDHPIAEERAKALSMWTQRYGRSAGPTPGEPDAISSRHF